MDTYLSYIVAAIFLFLMFWGGKFSGFKEFHEDHFGLTNTRSLRGIAALGVIVHHISQKEFYREAGELRSFYNTGYLFVSVFLFISGFGLAKSLKNKPGYLNGFMSKRLPVIIIPFYVSAVICTFVRLLTGEQLPLSRWICNLIGITAANDYAWYPIVLTILYIVFYLVFRKDKNRYLGLLIILATVLGLGLLFSVGGHSAWWFDAINERFDLGIKTKPWWAYERLLWFSGEWWVDANIAFFLGLLFAFKEEKINTFFRKVFFFKLSILILLYINSYFISLFGQSVFGYYSEYQGKGLGIGDKIITFFMQMPHPALFVILIYVVFMKYRFDNPVLRFFGNYSYETYMMNFLPVELLVVLQYMLSGFKLRAVYFIAVVAITVGSALIYKAINKPLIRLVTAKVSKK